MLDFKTPHGNKVESDGTIITISDINGKTLFTFHPAYGMTTFGYPSEKMREVIRKDYDYARSIISRRPYPVQCEG
jgi:acetylornithine/succinyldiaminopimelate/putrescine aminotransferase